MEHRWGQRVATNIAVSLIAKPATIGVGRMLDVSLTGTFVQTRLGVPLLSLLYLEPTIPAADGGRVGRVAACVVRRSADGVGLEGCDNAADMVEWFISTARGKQPPTVLCDRRLRNAAGRFSGR